MSCSNTNLDGTKHMSLKWYVALYPEYKLHYRPFGFGYGIYIWVSILYTTRDDTSIHPKSTTNIIYTTKATNTENVK